MSRIGTLERVQRNIKALRREQGWSLQQAAERIGITKPHLWELEGGRGDRRQNPTLATLEGLAGAYGIDALLFGEILAMTAATAPPPQRGTR